MMQQTYDDNYLKHIQCHQWYQYFKSGRSSTEDNHTSGSPSTFIIIFFNWKGAIYHMFTPCSQTIKKKKLWLDVMRLLQNFSLSKLKSSLTGCRFQSIELITDNSLHNLHNIPENELQGAFRTLENTLGVVNNIGKDHFWRRQV